MRRFFTILFFVTGGVILQAGLCNPYFYDFVERQNAIRLQQSVYTTPPFSETPLAGISLSGNSSTSSTIALYIAENSAGTGVFRIDETEDVRITENSVWNATLNGYEILVLAGFSEDVNQALDSLRFYTEDESGRVTAVIDAEAIVLLLATERELFFIDIVTPPPNQPPVNTVPDLQQVFYRQPHIMNFQVSDADSGNNWLSVVLQVGQGRLNAVPLGGAQVTGNDSNELTISGTLQAVNQTLWGADEGSLMQGISYHYTGADIPPNRIADDQLTMTSVDHVGGRAINTVPIQIINPYSEPIQIEPNIVVVPPPVCELDMTNQNAAFVANTHGAYTIQIADASYVLPVNFIILSGALPAGITLSGDTVSGTATAPSSTIVQIQVTDARGCTAIFELSVTVS